MRYCCKDMMLSLGDGNFDIKWTGVEIACYYPSNMRVKFCPYCGKELFFGEEKQDMADQKPVLNFIPADYNSISTPCPTDGHVTISCTNCDSTE